MTAIINHEFPDFDRALPVIDGFHDESWHNDVCPSLRNDDLNLTLWCDYADESLRELPEGKLYTLVHGAYGEVDEQTTLIESDDLAEILSAIDIRREDQKLRDDMKGFGNRA